MAFTGNLAIAALTTLYDHAAGDRMCQKIKVVNDGAGDVVLVCSPVHQGSDSFTLKAAESICFEAPNITKLTANGAATVRWTGSKI